ncbi:hypothetical protein [Clostridium sp. BJN0001]|uniref:hypothetical protein n=1 Tax=Clostridium sp. BJN0001 TaxID=2930219 RepID=UPI001FD347BC|nr:hypothetical protein [Clostridium sp. BJN0001]
MKIRLNEKETELILCALQGLRDIDAESVNSFKSEEDFTNEISEIESVYRRIKMQMGLYSTEIL